MSNRYRYPRSDIDVSNEPIRWWDRSRADRPLASYLRPPEKDVLGKRGIGLGRNPGDPERARKAAKASQAARAARKAGG
jgi:hypothetical protein